MPVEIDKMMQGLQASPPYIYAEGQEELYRCLLMPGIPPDKLAVFEVMKKMTVEQLAYLNVWMLREYKKKQGQKALSEQSVASEGIKIFEEDFKEMLEGMGTLFFIQVECKVLENQIKYLENQEKELILENKKNQRSILKRINHITTISDPDEKLQMKLESLTDRYNALADKVGNIQKKTEENLRVLGEKYAELLQANMPKDEEAQIKLLREKIDLAKARKKSVEAEVSLKENEVSQMVQQCQIKLLAQEISTDKALLKETMGQDQPLSGDPKVDLKKNIMEKLKKLSSEDKEDFSAKIKKIKKLQYDITYGKYFKILGKERGIMRLFGKYGQTHSVSETQKQVKEVLLKLVKNKKDRGETFRQEEIKNIRDVLKVERGRGLHIRQPGSLRKFNAFFKGEKPVIKEAPVRLASVTNREYYKRH